jgi:hypothetical protein
VSPGYEFRPLSAAEQTPVANALRSAQFAVTPAGILELSMGPRVVGGQYFRAQLVGRDFVEGLANAGPYPGQRWIEIFDLDLPPAIASVAESAVELAPFLRPLTRTVPPGGHLMIEYEKPLWRTTQLGLLAGVPPLATPMGELLFELGTGDSFKDWYFPEGGQEGGRKLQGNRAADEAQRLEFRRRRAAELVSFLATAPRADPAIDQAARKAAVRLVDTLRR